MIGDLIQNYKLLTGKYDGAMSNIMPKRPESMASLSTIGHVFKIFH